MATAVAETTQKITTAVSVPYTSERRQEPPIDAIPAVASTEDDIGPAGRRSS